MSRPRRTGPKPRPQRKPPKVCLLRVVRADGARPNSVTMQEARGRAMLGAVGRLDPTGRIQRFAKHYTMQSERDVHEAVSTGKASAPVALAVEPSTETGGGDLGDNVELF